MKVKTKILCTICEEPVLNKANDAMFFCGEDIELAPLIIAHKGKCAPQNSSLTKKERMAWVYSHDIMPKLWKMLNYKKIPK